VNPLSDSKELKKAYYKIVFKYHPDNKITTIDKELSNKQMMVINGAYRVLKDPVLRSEYDKQLKKGLRGSFAGIKGTNKNENSKYKKTISSSSQSSSSNSQKVEDKQESSSSSSTKSSSSSRSSSSTTSTTNSNNNKRYIRNENLFNTSSPTARTFWETYKDSDIWNEVDEYINNDDKVSNNINQNIYNNVKRRRKRYDDDDDDDESFDNNDNYDDDDSKYFYQKDMINDKFIGRGDGSLTSLKLHLQSLINLKKKKENLLLLDNRDWGEVTDRYTIEKRLADIQEVRNLEMMISDVEDEIESILYRSKGTYAQNDAMNKKNNNNDYQRWKEPLQPQPQPQRSKTNNDYYDNNDNSYVDPWDEWERIRRI